jgi:adenine-specific DNA-methyltransferase
LMTAISLRHLDKSDGVCLLLPAQWLESQYAVPLRDYLATLARRRVELRLVESQLFPDAEVDAVALLVGRERENEQPFTIATLKAAQIPVPVDRADLIGKQWRRLFGSTPRALNPGSTADRPLENAKLSDFCIVRRGIATGANSFFVLSDDDAIRHQLDSKFLLKRVRRLNPYQGAIDDSVFNASSSSEKRWLLRATHADRSNNNALDRYLRAGESSRISAGYLCQERKSDWYDLTHDLFTPDVIVSPMTRGRVKFVENKIRAVITNNLYGWRWLPEVSADARRAILTWLRSDIGQQVVLAAARQQGAGLIKIEPNALSSIHIPRSVTN